MKKKVWLSIKGKLHAQDQDEEIVELFTEGELYNKEKSQYILYKESEVSGMKGTTTTVKIEKDQVTIIRLGTTNSHLVFKEGQTKHDRYETPYGDLLMSICTKSVDVKYNDKKDPIAIHLDYDLEIDGNQGSSNTLDIQVKH